MTPIEVDAARPATPATHELQWTQARWWRPIWELREGERVLVTLRRTHWYRTELVADIEGAAWRCTRHDLKELRLMRADADQPEMSFHPYWWHADEDTERPEAPSATVPPSPPPLSNGPR